jgi:hypothetical protein
VLTENDPSAAEVRSATTRTADLRAYYSKHAKNDRLDSEIVAKLPLLHLEGLREFIGGGSSDPLRRLTKQRSTMVKRRTAVYPRLDALVAPVPVRRPQRPRTASTQRRHARH